MNTFTLFDDETCAKRFCAKRFRSYLFTLFLIRAREIPLMISIITLLCIYCFDLLIKYSSRILAMNKMNNEWINTVFFQN